MVQDFTVHKVQQVLKELKELPRELKVIRGLKVLWEILVLKEVLQVHKVI